MWCGVVGVRGPTTFNQIPFVMLHWYEYVVHAIKLEKYFFNF